MRKSIFNTYILPVIILLTFIGFDIQGQEALPYQAVVRDNGNGSIIANKDIKVRFTIRKKVGSTAVYQESHEVKTDAGGLFSLEIGKGVKESGDFKSIDWAAGPYNIQTQINHTGSGFTINSIQELYSIPYAQHAETAGSMQKVNNGKTTWQLTVDEDGNVTTVPIPEGYSKLVFHDEFNGTGLPDPNKWSYEEGYVRNGELQYYMIAREDNCFRKDGNLHIRVLNDSVFVKDALLSQYPDVRKDSVVPFTSASIHTKDKSSWTYCRVEMKAKLPLCKGTWPAIWMMPEKEYYPPYYWPSGGEIDIMEHVGYDPNKVHYTMHCDKENGANNAYHKSTNIYNVNTEWHVYALEWHEDRMEWYLDGTLKFRIKKPTNKPTGDINDENYINNPDALWRWWPYMHPFYLMVNSAWGGGWGGQQGIDISGLPQDYIIDYVRVFQ